MVVVFFKAALDTHTNLSPIFPSSGCSLQDIIISASLQCLGLGMFIGKVFVLEC
jgi:hypothetical protein